MLWWIYYRRQEGCGCQDANRDPGKRNTKWVGLRCRTRSRPRWVDVITVGGVGEGGGWKRWMGLGHLSILYSLPISTLFLIHNNRLFLIYTTWSSVLNIYIRIFCSITHFVILFLSTRITEGAISNCLEMCFDLWFQ